MNIIKKIYNLLKKYVKVRNEVNLDLYSEIGVGKQKVQWKTLRLFFQELWSTVFQRNIASNDPNLLWSLLTQWKNAWIAMANFVLCDCTFDRL